MSYLEISKQILKGEKIFNIPLRVCFYARVSTDSEVQLNSLDNQLEYYENYIKSIPKWTYIEGYVDEGISGVRVEKRIGFQKMIKDARHQKFDLIITKEVSRFARDLEDSIHYIRILKEAGVGVFFENQNLNTFDTNSELILNIMFNLAEEESKKLSSRIKFGHNQAIKNGHVLGSSNIIGYRKNDCKLVIIPEEAKFIRKLFDLYASGEYGLYKLSKKLGEFGYYNKKGNLYDKDTLKRIILNPKYKGFYRGKTTEIVDYRTKKRKKINENEQIIYKSNNSIVPAIVSENVWNKANEILKVRTKNNHNNNNYAGGLKYPFSSKIYCKEHYVNYQRTKGGKKKNRPTWSCSKYLKYHLDACKSPIIAEMDLYNILSNVFNKIITKKEVIINEMIELYQNINYKNTYSDELKNLDNKIKKIENRKSFLIDLVIDGELSKDNLKIQFKNLEDNLIVLNKEKLNILKQIEIIKNNYNNDILYEKIKEGLEDGALDGFIRIFVSKIIVSKIDNDRNNILLDIYLDISKNIDNDTIYINDIIDNSSLFLKNQKYVSMEKLRKDKKKNYFFYNVMILNGYVKICG